MEEEKGNPEEIDILLVNRDTICSIITEDHPPHVKSWERKNNNFRAAVDDVKSAAHLKCTNNKKIISVEFASFGDPYGACGGFVMGKCNAPNTKEVVEQVKYLLPTCLPYHIYLHFFSFGNH